MVIRVRKNDKESVDRVISRFNKKVQSSRILLNKRRNRYYQKPLTKRKQRQKAIKREEYRTLRDKTKFT
ncbi:30S ribosomal protein S21 [Candidatus Peregrinibacteria bacterium]|nr:30S ribosomal protein S21 [Candidatus Peregrinibacteria bacterium]